ncbi:ATP-binding protein [Streptomyces californicus]|uniref:ATP-binding protein n=1 Tax=Streptomyces californicus TaxID=67351 RepID=A0ABD7CVV2_9ACTN|nr:MULTISPECIES: ATP-binding protein [Streptomyces]QRV28975.1 ATP-binding protein [Streptomyces californicus]QRV35420.1 ATP-binding protein [Streptomyces californicus]QRV42389.1 ATP-binding protein [Streptomyces californicus]QRV49070.1 ATP-binding protein [Streptomyces californicus]
MTAGDGVGPDLRHLLARTAAVERRIRHAVELRRSTDPDPDDDFRGLYLTDESIARLLDDERARGFPTTAGFAAEGLRDGAEASEEEAASRLGRLAREFGLTVLDTEILLIALVPDLDDRFEAFYGYLNDDVSRRRPSIGLALGLCGAALSDPAARARLAAGAPLRAGGLLLVEELNRPFLSRALRVPDRVAAHLLGDDAPDPRLAELLAPWQAVAGAGDPATLAGVLADGVALAYLSEDQGGAGTALAASALARAGLGVLGLDLARLAEDSSPAEAVRALVREARLTGAGLVCAPLDAVSRDRPGLLRLLTAAPVPTVLVGRAPWDASWSAVPPLLLHAPRVEPSARGALWREAYEQAAGAGRGPMSGAGHGGRPPEVGHGDPSGDAAALPAGASPGHPPAIAAPLPPGIAPDHLLAPFLLTPEQITGAARSAAQSARLAGGELTADHVRQGARAQNAAGLDRLARRIEPTVGWEDLVLPPDTRTQLRELTARARHRDRVLGEWGMRPGGGRGRGVSALFAGDSGTGKTMSAEVIAADLGLDLYTVDLATVIDKYVGETEKNLERIFTEAAGVNGVLLFDEADAIFGKRSDVKDAHDRYANVESAYLLQRMESFDGLAVLATNLRANLDDAFTRRLDLVVDFPVPDPEQRLLLWDRCLGPTLPRSADLDLAFCAENFELAGGNIRSIAVTSAYLAAEAGSAVTMETVIHAIQREYQKLGRLTLASEFGPYLGLVQG